jgi:hypothetical protein
MNKRGKEPLGAGGRPVPPLIAGVMIGMTISSLAVSAIMLGTGMAIAQTLARPK